MTVKDYICANTTDGALYSVNSLTVSGTFKPESDRHWGCTLASGATLDLTDWEGPWNATSVSGRAVIFPTTAGATVNVNLAGRADFTLLQKDVNGNRILATWAAMPENTKFVLDAGALGKRTIFSGIRQAYPEPEKLIGKEVVFVANLAPRKMSVGVSEGMILFAGEPGVGGGVLSPSSDAGAGTQAT
jgi:methionyl-tRNA synthetase